MISGFPQAFAAALDKTVQTKELVIDVLTDVRCPFSYISHLNLEKALYYMILHHSILYDVVLHYMHAALRDVIACNLVSYD